MRNKLTEIIKQLYRVFSNYPGNPQMTGISAYGEKIKDWNRALFSKPLSELNDDDLSRFTGKVMTTWGGIDDLKHFLPRMLELTAIYKTPYEIWILFNKLELADWNNWPTKEQLVLKNYLAALLENLINDDSKLAEYDFIDYFTSILFHYPLFQELLQVLDASKSKAKYKHLSNLIIEQGDLIFRKGKIDGFYKTDKYVKALQSWLSSKAFLEELSQAYFKYEQEAFAEKISWAEQIIHHASNGLK